MKPTPFPSQGSVPLPSKKGDTTALIRTFATGAIRDTEQGKFDFEGFLSPLALEAFAAYMHKHRQLPDGSLRDSDNWQHGFPRDVLMKSGWRHFFDWWSEHRGYGSREGLENALCGLLFNTFAYLHQLKEEQDGSSLQTG